MSTIVDAKKKDTLIELVYKCAVIWDKRHPQHHNRYILIKVWDEISQKLGVKSIEARSTWKNLRQEFGKQIKKTDEYGVQWPYFNKLMFLQGQFRNADNSDNSKDPLSMDDESISLSDSNFITEDHESDISDDGEYKNIIKLCRLTGVEGSTTVPAASSEDYQEIEDTKIDVKRRKTTQDEVEDDVREAKKEKSDVETNRSSRIDEDVGFFSSLLPTVKTLSPKDKFKFRMKVQEILYELAFP